MTSFLCVGDLHLGAGIEYGREPGDRLRDQEAVWARALELAADHDVDAVLFAGDAFHRRRPTPAELIAFQRPLQAFTAEHDIEVVSIAGNHDCEAAELPTALDVFGREVDLFSKPGVWRAPDGGATVACLPWTPVSRLVAAHGRSERTDVDAAEILIAAARDLRAQIDGPAVLLLHWSISGASTPTGVFTDDFREPVIPVDELEALGFDAIVAGHIHRPQALGQSAGRHVLFDAEVQVSHGTASAFYVGSPVPVDFGEQATPHGCWILDVEDTVTSAFLPIESRPFITIDADLVCGHHAELGLDETDGMAAAIAARLPLDDAVVRIRYRATEEQARRIEWPKLRPLLDHAYRVFAITGDIERSDRVRVAGVDEHLEPLEAVDLWVEHNAVNGGRDGLVDLTSRYLEEVGAT